MGRIVELKIPQQTIDSIFPIDDRINIEWWDREESAYGGIFNKCSYILHVKKGDVLCRINYRYPIMSPVDGYVIRRPLDDYGLFSSSKEDIENLLLGVCCENIDDVIKCLFGEIECNLRIDPFTKKHRIEGVFCGYWDSFAYPYPLENWAIGSSYEDSFVWIEIANNIFLRFEFIEDNAIISFDTIDEDIIHKGDTISLLLDNDDILDYTLSKKPIQKKRYGFTLFQDDIDALLYNRIVSCRITYADEEEMPMDLDFKNSVLGDYARDALHYYLSIFIEEVKKLFPSYIFPIRKAKRTQSGFGFNWCYVYLMKDISNGYYKIGISNTPEYRERTLQSEKPTIELLASKKFPTRKIAEAIESALHTVYSQQRLRGEWFKLDDADVAAIIETLK